METWLPIVPFLDNPSVLAVRGVNSELNRVCFDAFIRILLQAQPNPASFYLHSSIGRTITPFAQDSTEMRNLQQNLLDATTKIAPTEQGLCLTNESLANGKIFFSTIQKRLQARLAKDQAVTSSIMYQYAKIVKNPSSDCFMLMLIVPTIVCNPDSLGIKILALLLAFAWAMLTNIARSKCTQFQRDQVAKNIRIPVTREMITAGETLTPQALQYLAPDPDTYHADIRTEKTLQCITNILEGYDERLDIAGSNTKLITTTP